MLGSKKKEEAFPVNEVLLNVITPMGLEIKRNSLVIGENLGKVYGAVRYPQKVDMGWLSKITNIPSTIVSVGITPIDNGSLISAISKSIVQQRGAADSAKDPLTRQRAEKAAEDGEKIMLILNGTGATTLMELFIIYRRCVEYLKEKNIEIAANYVGELLTVQEQAGFQMFMARMDDELLHYWNAPCNTPYMKK